MLRPFSPASEALQLAGILSPKKSQKEATEQSQVRDILDSHGASLDDAAAALSVALRDPEKNSWAPKLAFQLHGALKDTEVSQVPTININVLAADNSKTLLQFVTPNISNSEIPLVEGEE